MSAGPIQQARDARAVPAASTSDNARVCMRTKTPAGYCGRMSARERVTHWDAVSCADCRAAGRADGVAVPEGIPGVAS